MKRLLEAVDKMQFAGEKDGQKPGEQWRGNDKKTPGNKLVGEENVVKELEQHMKENAVERRLTTQLAEFKQTTVEAQNDYFKRRKDEEDRIAGTKAPAKRTPKQTDYEKKRKQQGVAEAGGLDNYRQRVQSQGFTDSPEERDADRLDRKRRHNAALDRIADIGGNSDEERAHRAQQRMARDEIKTDRMKKDDDDWENTFDMMRDRINRYQWSSQRDVDPEQLAAISNIKYEPRKKNEAVQSQPSQQSAPSSRAVDAKGRTQQQWMKLVKAKFPDAKIMQSKMIDGPVFAMLSDGRKLSWNKVEQGVAEATEYGIPDSTPGQLPGGAKMMFGEFKKMWPGVILKRPSGGSLAGSVVADVEGWMNNPKSVWEPLEGVAEDNLQEVAPVIFGAAARFIVPKVLQLLPKIGNMAKQAPKVVGNVTKQAAPVVGKVTKQGAEIVGKNAGAIGTGAGVYTALTTIADGLVGGVGEVYDDVKDATTALTDKIGDALDTTTIASLAAAAVKYSIPIGIVLAMLYGGKKVIDKMISEQGVAEGLDKEALRQELIKVNQQMKLNHPRYNNPNSPGHTDRYFALAKKKDTILAQLKQGVAEGWFGIDSKTKGAIQNVVAKLSDIPGMWDFNADTFTDAGMDKLKTVLKNNPKYIKYAVNLTADDFDADLEENEKIGGRYDPDEFDAMVARLGQKAKQGPMKTVWDPVKRVYKTVPVNQTKQAVKEYGNAQDPDDQATTPGAQGSAEQDQEDDLGAKLGAAATNQSINALKSISPDLNTTLAKQALAKSDMPTTMSSAETGQAKELSDLLGDALGNPQTSSQVTALLRKAAQSKGQ